MRVVDPKRWSNTKNTLAIITWLTCGIYLSVRPTSIIITQDVFITIIMTISGINLFKQILNGQGR